ncbi:GNAT family N-acetyltransferase [Solirubrobacter soli]|uniref:GNAT family N-acetyltransferase n=1 Tax=Solirubrobacter soli TaxID=363832 RepID=UPI0012F88816|nr:GNAT family N-acetyltransferase [Solirubrobacter soli]
MLPLDNPVYSALDTDHAHFAVSHGLAKRYPGEVARFAGLREASAAGFADLEALVEPGETVALVTAADVVVPDGWELARGRLIDQMVCDRPPAPAPAGPPLLELGVEDVPEMLDLAELTQPGPFGTRTLELGRYLGIRVDGRLAAMAGERMRPSGATEISAVCTHPDFTGRGYARALMTPLLQDAFAAGRSPMLHVKTENGAKRLYDRLGFTVRHAMRLTIVTRAR